MSETAAQKRPRPSGGVGTRGERIATGTLLLCAGAAVTAVTYVVIYMLALGILWLAGRDGRFLGHAIAVGMLLVAGLSMAIASPDYWNRFSFDTRERKESELFPFLNIGARKSRVNPLGPQSLAATVKMLAIPLLFGPGLIVEAAREFISLREVGGNAAPVPEGRASEPPVEGDRASAGSGPDRAPPPTADSSRQ